MANQALGLIETQGLVGAIEAADAATKAAAVDLVEIEYTVAAPSFCTVKLRGLVADVLTAVDAGANGAQRVGNLISRHVIPQPVDDTEKLVEHKPALSAASNSYDAMSVAVKEKLAAKKTPKGKKK